MKYGLVDLLLFVAFLVTTKTSLSDWRFWLVLFATGYVYLKLYKAYKQERPCTICGVLANGIFSGNPLCSRCLAMQSTQTEMQA
jgi:hypothetical protein